MFAGTSLASVVEQNSKEHELLQHELPKHRNAKAAAEGNYGRRWWRSEIEMK